MSSSLVLPEGGGAAAKLRRVLVIDDSPAVRSEVRATLAPAGYEVIEAADGVSGAAAISDGATELGLVICDVNMPQLTGIELLESLAQSASSRSVPILMLTSEGRPSLMQRARRAGAKGWLLKPFNPAVLLTAVRKLLPIDPS